MKKKFIHVGKRTLSVVLSIMMIVSMMIVGVVTTTAATNFTVYFENTLGWSEVWVYFFKDNPWGDNGVEVNSKKVGYGKMSSCGTSSGGKTVYSYTYTGTDEVNYIAFALKDQNGYGQFHVNTVSYATKDKTFDSSQTLWTPLNSSVELNACTYFNSGTWSNYTPASSGYTYALIGDSTITSGDTAAAWNGASANDYKKSSSLKFTGNTLTVTAEKDNQFRFIGTNGTNYKNYGSTRYQPVTLDKEYTTTAGDSNTYKFPKTGTFQIKILSGTDSPLKFKVTEVTTSTTWKIFGDNFNGWTESSNGTALDKVSDTLYKKEFTTFAGGCFAFTDGSKQYGPSTNGDELGNSSSKSPVSQVKNAFNGPSNLTDVTIYLDVTSGSMKAWYESNQQVTQLTKPSISVDSHTIADGSTVTLTVGTSYDSAANVSYELYKDGATNAYASFSTSTYQITEAGTYQVKAISGNTSSYSNSELSDSVTVSKATVTTTDYYVVGRFKTSNPGEDTGKGWADSSKIKFTKSTDTLYKLETNSTLKDLSTCYGEPYFAIKSVTGPDSKFYGRSGNFFFNDRSETTVTLSEVGTTFATIGNNCLKFDFASDTNTNPVTLCLDVTNPDAPVFYYEVVFDTEKYSVKMEPGITSRRDGEQLGSSYLEGDPTKTMVKNPVEDLTVTFTTQTVKVENPTYNDLSLGYTGYMYQVYGYSILMQVYNDDGTTSTRTASVVNNLVDSNSAKPISALANGVYTCEYTFPSNIKSATVTPIFSVSADYAKAKGISYTAVYLKMTPGSNLFSNTYEPKYYTWRAEKRDADVDNGEPMFVSKNGRVLEREPEGAYGGQKMLSVGTDMYLAYVQSDLYGILFDNSSVQTFDYNEFIKLQQLGYNNITFEPKGDGSTETVASTLNGKYKDNGTKVYNAEEQSKQDATSIDDDNINQQFELDVDIEGYYIDVFGNRLQDKSGKDIKRSDLLAESSDTTVVAELNALLDKTGKTNKLFGARYGEQNRENTEKDYGMKYAIYNYFVDGTTMKLISQQVSGYGTIEGAIGPNSSSMTNAAYMASLKTPMTYRVGTASSNKVENFSIGYELISSDYVGVPYLVSYKLKSDGIRVDGKWYYMSRTPQVTVNVKTSLLNIDGSLNMSSAGKIVENTTPGTATVNYKSFDTIDQGTSAVMRATPNEGFAFVGFYEENGDFISKYNPYGNKVFAVDTTVYAVFKKVANGSITITNNIYDSAKPNPTPGGGNGKVSVTLVITPWDHDDEQGNPVYGTPVSYTGETSVSATINDGDKFHIILTGERSGADNFLAFRMPDKDIYGNLYYVALDDAEFLNVTNDTNGKAVSATYETADMVWDWTEQLGTGGTSNTLQAKTFNYYTDFSKTDINATLEYRYKDRFGNWKTYIVKNVPMDVSQINQGNYVPDNSLVLKYAPPIDEVFNSCSWTAANIDARNSYALLIADQTYKTFNTYVDRDADDIYSVDEKIVAPFNESIQIEAPETKGSATFRYWKRYLLDSTGAKSGSGEIFSNMRSISIKVTFDSVFEPVYDAVSDTYFTNVQDAKYTREKSTDDKGFVHDYVYADFLLQFDTLEGNDTFKNIVAKNGNIKFGVILEMDYNYSYAGKTITTPTTDENLLKQTITQLNTGLAEGGHKSGWNVTTDSQLAQYNYYYNLYDLTDKASNLSNFGRYDYFFKFANTEANRARVYNVYSYIIYTDSDGKEQIVVSNPKTLSIYATGIKNDGETA